jgi:PhnB protein
MSPVRVGQGERCPTRPALKEAHMPVKPIPDGYTAVTPYLIVDDGAAAIEFYTKAFGAVEQCRMLSPDGKVAHAEITIGDARIMLGQECPVTGSRSPKSLGGTATGLMIYLEDVDSRFKQALAAGAQEKQAVKDQFYGDRSGTVVDPFGHVWTLATHVEDVTIEECRRRYEALLKASQAA